MNALFGTTNGFNFEIVNSLIYSGRGVRLTWRDCNSVEESGEKNRHVIFWRPVMGLSAYTRVYCFGGIMI